MGGAGWCTKCDGTDLVGKAQKKIKGSKGSTIEECLALCNQQLDARGCEWNKKNGKCSYHTGPAASVSGNEGYYCWVKPGEIKL